MKPQRRRDLLRILHEGRASSQSAIVEALRAAGHEVTQATVSRDLQELGAAKTRTPDGFVYRLSEEIVRTNGGDLTARNLERTLAEFAMGIARAGTIVVVTTAPGHASAVARAIDLAGLPSIVGTIAGDDTIFIATPDTQQAGDLVRAWNENSIAAAT